MSADMNVADQLWSDPSAQLFAQLADFYRENGLLNEAVEICLNGLEANPDNIEGRLVLARCYLDSHEPEKAREQITRVLARQPENSTAKKILLDIDRLGQPAAPAGVPLFAPESPPLQVTEAEADAVISPPAPGTLESAEAKEAVQTERPAVAEGPKAAREPAEGKDLANNYGRIVQDLLQTPQIMASLLVEDSGFVVASAYHPKYQGGADEETAGALAISIFKTGAEAMNRIRMGQLERIIIDTSSEKLFLNRADPLLLLVSAEPSAKMGLVAVNTRQAVDRVRSTTQK